MTIGDRTFKMILVAELRDDEWKRAGFWPDFATGQFLA